MSWCMAWQDRVYDIAWVWSGRSRGPDKPLRCPLYYLYANEDLPHGRGKKSGDRWEWRRIFIYGLCRGRGTTPSPVVRGIERAFLEVRTVLIVHGRCQWHDRADTTVAHDAGNKDVVPYSCPISCVLRGVRDIKHELFVPCAYRTR